MAGKTMKIARQGDLIIHKKQALRQDL